MTRRSLFIACLVAGTVCARARDAQANGRFPYANEIVAHPKEPSSLVVRTTFGLLTTLDRGATIVG